MKTITIYPTVVNISEDIAIDTLIAIQGFEDILEADISPERHKELTEACMAIDIRVISVVIPDGFTDENTISKVQFKELLDIAKYCDTNTYNIVFDEAKEKSEIAYIPFTIWEHNHGGKCFEFYVEHAACNTEDEAYSIANKGWRFGLFIAPTDLPERKLRFGFIDKSGSVYHVPKRYVKGYFLNPTIAERLADPIDVTTQEGKDTASKVLMTMDPAYMVNHNDYLKDPTLTTNEGMISIPGAIGITLDHPLLFGSLSYFVQAKK